jgi:hypothetical protein
MCNQFGVLPPTEVCCPPDGAVMCCAELSRRTTAQGPFDDSTAEVAALCSAAKQLAQEELQAWAVGFSGQLLEGAPLALAVVHRAVGARLAAWASSTRTLDDDTCAVSHLALGRLVLQDSTVCDIQRLALPVLSLVLTAEAFVAGSCRVPGCEPFCP